MLFYNAFYHFILEDHKEIHHFVSWPSASSNHLLRVPFVSTNKSRDHSVPSAATLELQRPGVLRLEHVSESPRGFIKKKKRILGPSPTVSVPVNLGWDPTICISNNFTVVKMLLSWWPPFENPCSRFFLTTMRSANSQHDSYHESHQSTWKREYSPAPHRSVVLSLSSHFHWVSRSDIHCTKSPLLHHFQIVPPSFGLIP